MYIPDPPAPRVLACFVLSLLGAIGVVFVITSIRNYGEERGAIFLGILGVVALCWVVFVFFGLLSGIEGHAAHLSLTKFFYGKTIQIAWEDIESIHFYRLSHYRVIMRIRMRTDKGLPMYHRISIVFFAPSWARYPPWVSLERFVGEIKEKGHVATCVWGDLKVRKRR